ncbi:MULTISPECIES: dicarboxylate/amino acid:cation symporter [Paraclostridium]|uniref:Dicarboxylate/amino acid:cation symporter n=3 Tax=Paraclostridium TaxID=1849822 RepID=A0A1X2JHI5_PARBF|nr:MULTISPECIES: dicarboxylate/amino acid:cation symporter [Paraclostridium]KGJ50861.1 sodium:dicarboxylate symporter [Clostridium sp. NCR]MBN8046309.1 dicarboxylate/amino acid:cation symporter [Paraclostridium bifermentans]MBZ6005288.1 dicarboxylate/amino acid:cation symporter [Paraclostridium bifermentans]MCE9674252.1 dicarboxylate/amino acid:cation symporter [Paraclostridium bifermentans]MCR1875291.1 dicarboxylate/amino acid:cation symporter [Paraclostridium bifermentans]
MKKLFDSLIFKLILAVFLGLLIGLYSPKSFMNVIVTLKYILGQVIFFAVPLIIIGFIAPSIAKLKSNASKLLGYAITFAYISSIGAATFSAIFGYMLIPKLSIQSTTDTLRELPALIFQLDIPQIMPVMSALFLSIILGLATAWTKADLFEKLLDQFQDIVLSLVKKIVIPLLPIFIATTFATLAYEGSITNQLPVFIKVIIIVLIGHFIWLAFLYALSGFMSGKNPMEVLKHYGPAYLTAVGSMSSAATLPVSIECAKKSKVLRKDILNFSIPLFSNIHLCGSVLTEVFFVMVVSQILYGKLPDVSSMILFIVLLGIFAIGAPGVPGGTVMASLGLITSVLGFNETGTALILTIFALQDSFGTACNVTADGALTLMLTGVANKKNIKEESEEKSI